MASNDPTASGLVETSGEEVKRSSRDPEVLRHGLEAWLAGRIPGATGVEVTNVSSPSATGLSSETLLFEARWREGSREASASLVARVQPDPADVPVFPVYDMKGQFDLLRIVAERSRVPVPRVRWLEPDPGHLGAPFFVMDRVEGRVPPDVMPYTFGSWLSEAASEDRRRLQDESVGLLADLHAIDASAADLGFLEFDVPGESPLRRHCENQRRYYSWAQDDRRHPILEAAFEWLEGHWPDDEGETVVSWGDARIGNVLYDGFAPAAVLDWEMAALGPRGLDLGWMVFLHCFFDELAREMGKPGLPDFMRPVDVAATYAERSGVQPRNLDFYQVYAALRHGIVMTRVHARRVRFGEAEWPEDVDSVIYHRRTLEKMIDGSWWD